MDSWAYWVLLAAISLVAVDIVVLLGFLIYVMITWCRRNRGHEILKEDEVINYDDMVAIQTKPIPVVFEDPYKRELDDYNFPKTRAGTSTSSDDFDVPMYFSELSQGESLECNETNEEPKPQISLSVHFEQSANELTIVLRRGKHLNCGRGIENQQQHIMVSAMLMPDGSILHSCKGIPPNPLFKHKYIFNVKKEALKNSTVKLNVWKIDKYSTRVPFGECALSLGDVFKDDSTEYIEDVWLEVQPKDQLENETAKGELLTSIQYLPGSERINISVMKARGLQLEDFDKDVYVKVSAVLNGKVIRNKKTGASKKTPNPLFNEMTTIQLNAELTLDNLVIILSVYAYRLRGPHKRLVGRCFVGNVEVTLSKGEEHWKKMIENPHKMLAEWHELQ